MKWYFPWISPFFQNIYFPFRIITCQWPTGKCFVLITSVKIYTDPWGHLWSQISDMPIEFGGSSQISEAFTSMKCDLKFDTRYPSGTKLVGTRHIQCWWTFKFIALYAKDVHDILETIILHTKHWIKFYLSSTSRWSQGTL